MNKIVVFVFFVGCATLAGENYAKTKGEIVPCTSSRQNYERGGPWDRKCGPRPGADFTAELLRDCATTTADINRFGGSWNSRHGWASDWQCDYLDNSLKLWNTPEKVNTR